jgi:hypothetical protein
MHPLSCKPISSVPKLANRTPLAVVIGLSKIIYRRVARDVVLATKIIEGAD